MQRSRGLIFLICSVSVIILTVFYWAVFDSYFVTTLSGFLWRMGRLAGLVGFFFLSVLIISGDTARFFDRFFGMDKIIKFQRKFSLITAVFVLAHPLFFILSRKTVAPFLIPNFAIFPLAMGIVALYLFIIIMICSLLYKRISYQAWQYIHIVIYVLFFISIYHVINWGNSFAMLPVKVFFFAIFFIMLAAIAYRTIYKLRQIWGGKFYVSEKVQETSDTFSIFLTSTKPLKFKAGQFCFLRLNKNKLYARHPFSFSSSPNEEKLRFTIKLAGRFTKALEEMKEGEEVIVDGPFGIFTVPSQPQHIVFIAGGVGVTPFMSIIEDNKKSSQPHKITLLYGSKTEQDIIFKKQLNSINENWFKKIYLLEKNNNPEYKSGYINEEIIRQAVPDFEKCLFYICGPEVMKKSVKKILKNLSVSRSNIIIEDFFW